MVRILIIGDSTTEGFLGGTEWSGWGGWRGRAISKLWRNLAVVPIGPDIVTDFPAWGHFWRTTTIAAARSALPTVFAGLADPPDVVVVMLGIHDGIAASWTVPAQPNTYTMASPMASLVTDIAAGAPDAQLFVCTISTLNTWSGLYNSYLPRALNEARAAGANVRLIDAAAGLVGSDIGSDGVHPTENGYILMAGNVYAGLTAALPVVGGA